MGLTTDQHLSLCSHFESSPAYLSDAMLDLIINRENAKCIPIILDTPFIGSDINGDHLQQAYQLIGNETKSKFNIIANSVLNLDWHTLIDVGSIPSFYDNFRKTVESLYKWIQGFTEIPATIKARLFDKYAVLLTDHIQEFYSYVKSLLSKAGILITDTLKSLFDTVVSIGMSIVKFAGKGIDVFVRAAGIIVKGVYKTLEMISELIFKAITYVSYAGMTMLEAFTNQGKKVQQFTAKVGVFILSIYEETFQYKKSDKNLILGRIVGFAEEFATVLENIIKHYIEDIIPESIIDFMKQHWFTKKIVNWLPTIESVVSWIISKLQWLMTQIAGFTSGTRFVWQAVMAQAPTLFMVLFPKIFDTISTLNPVVENGAKAANFMATTIANSDNVSEDTRKDIKEVIDLRKAIQQEYVDAHNSAQARLFEKSGSSAFSDQWVVSNEFARYLVGEPYNLNALLIAYENIQGVPFSVQLAAETRLNFALNVRLFNAVNDIFDLSGIDEDIKQIIIESEQTLVGNDIPDYKDTSTSLSIEQLRKLSTRDLLVRRSLLYKLQPGKKATILAKQRLLESTGAAKAKLDVSSIQRNAVKVAQGLTETTIEELAQLTIGEEGQLTQQTLNEDTIGAIAMSAIQHVTLTNIDNTAKLVEELELESFELTEELANIEVVLNERNATVDTVSSIIAGLVFAALFSTSSIVAWRYGYLEFPDVLASDTGYNVVGGFLSGLSTVAGFVWPRLKDFIDGWSDLAGQLIGAFTPSRLTSGTIVMPLFFFERGQLAMFAVASQIFGSTIAPTMSYGYDLLRLSISSIMRSNLRGWGYDDPSEEYYYKHQVNKIAAFWTRTWPVKSVVFLTSKGLTMIKYILLMIGVVTYSATWLGTRIPLIGPWLNRATMGNVIEYVRDVRKLKAGLFKEFDKLEKEGVEEAKQAIFTRRIKETQDPYSSVALELADESVDSLKTLALTIVSEKQKRAERLEPVDLDDFGAIVEYDDEEKDLF